MTRTETRSAERRRRKRKLAHALNRRRQRKGHPGRAAWRRAAATPEQIEALRLIATETGRTFRTDVTRGEAWKRIRETTALMDAAARSRCAPPWYSPPRSRTNRKENR